MPIYEYMCHGCHKNFEEIVFSRSETVTCPKCASDDVERQLSVFSAPAGRSGTAEIGGGGCGGCTPGGCGCH